MKKFLSNIWNYITKIFKVLLFLIIVVLIVYFLPREAKFKYEFQQGKPWMHKDLIATFDFAINKSEKDIKKEKEDGLKNIKPYFRYDTNIYNKKRAELIDKFDKDWELKYASKRRNIRNKRIKDKNIKLCSALFDTIYNKGIIKLDDSIADIVKKNKDKHIIVIKNNNVGEEKNIADFFTVYKANKYIQDKLSNSDKEIDRSVLFSVIQNSLMYNILFDVETTNNEKKLILDNISLTKGMVQRGEKIISKGDLITYEKNLVLLSFKEEYKKQLGTPSKYNFILIGQIILVCISIAVLILFLAFFRKDIFSSNKKIFLILLSIFLMIFITSVVVKYNIKYLYLVPICLVPIIIRAFYDENLALFIHVITIILIGFLVPNSFEFVFLQLIAGIVAIISLVNLRKRSQFFLTSFFVLLTYSLVYLCMFLVKDANFKALDINNFGLFAGNATLTLFSFPLIFIFEKTFGFLTDISLMEISDTNTKLLRKLATKAPGTFQHSIQVANLSEEVIFQIGGNTLLARTGAMYHDIGKMDMPLYFTENQITGINPHNELSYEESAEIIISHIAKGIKKAKKYKIPEKIIDFIRTHHGTTKAQYFYSMYLKDNPDKTVDQSIFTYPGPIPYSKESAVLMMVDSVEAASRSLKNPDEQSINNLVEKIIDNQIQQKQFVNSDITFRDIMTIKKILKKQLMNIYHLRVEYPE
jgi:putative nucleotidyltransferase with HDIG domain